MAISSTTTRMESVTTMWIGQEKGRLPNSSRITDLRAFRMETNRAHANCTNTQRGCPAVLKHSILKLIWGGLVTYREVNKRHGQQHGEQDGPSHRRHHDVMMQICVIAKQQLRVNMSYEQEVNAE